MHIYIYLQLPYPIEIKKCFKFWKILFVVFLHSINIPWWVILLFLRGARRILSILLGPVWGMGA